MRCLPWILLAACTEREAPAPPSEESPPRCAAGDPPESVSLGGASVAIGDVTGDGIEDWLRRAGTGHDLVAGPLPGRTWARLETHDEYLVRFSAGQLAGDPAADLVVARPWRGEVAIFVGPIAQGATLDVASPAIAISSRQDGFADLFGLASAIGDVTGDGVPDLVLGAPAEGEEACVGTRDTTVWPGPLAAGATTRDAAPLTIPAPPGSCLGNVLQLADIDGAPGPELVVMGQRETQVHALPLGDAPGVLAEGYYPVGVDDVDGDGQVDVVFESGAVALASGAAWPLVHGANVYVRASVPARWAEGSSAVVYESATPAVRRLVPGVERITDLPLLAIGEHGGEVTSGDLDADGTPDLVVGEVLLRCR